MNKESNFKVGDWVRHETRGVKKIVEIGVDKLFFENDDYEHTAYCRLWQPQEDDVVIFLDEPTPRLIKLQTSNMMYAKSLFTNNRCIPYIGQPFEEIRDDKK